MANTNNIIFIQEYKSPVGDLLVGSYQQKLCICDWKYRKQRIQIDVRIKTYFQAEFVSKSSEITNKTIHQLQEYFASERTTFTVPLQFAGTSFQKKVWQQLVSIPYGKTATYLSLSQHLGNKKAIRAVASANGANAISIIVPCHRIIGTNGDLVGYAGGLTAKRKLLQLEANSFQQQLFKE